LISNFKKVEEPLNEFEEANWEDLRRSKLEELA
jgi:hypothetical protein